MSPTSIRSSRPSALALVAGVALALSAAAESAPAQIPAVAPEAPRTIRVSGVGEFRVQPDLATVQFAVETTGATAQAAAQENADVMDRVIAALTAAGVRREDIQTSGYALFPEYAPQPRPGGDLEPPRIRGYRASNQVGVRTGQLERIGSLIDAGLGAGANRLGGVYFQLRDSRAAQTQALERAVAEARSAAETMARALGVQLGPVLEASTNAEPVQPMFRSGLRDMAMSAEAMQATTPIEPGEQTVRAHASVVFGIQ